MADTAIRMKRHAVIFPTLCRAGSYAAAVLAGACLLVVEGVLFCTGGRWQG